MIAVGHPLPWSDRAMVRPTKVRWRRASGRTHDRGVPPASDILNLVCNDCGGETALARGDCPELVAGLHAFLHEHRLCSYDVSLTFAAVRRESAVAAG